MSKLYCVSWEVNVEADDPIGAARSAMREMTAAVTDEDSINHVFLVRDNTDDKTAEVVTIVDLDVIDERL